MKYQYEALNSAGQMTTGELDATDRREAHRVLTDRGMQPVLLAIAAQKATSGRFGKLLQRKATLQHYVLGLREFATLLSGGVPITEAVEIQTRSPAHPDVVTGFDSILADLRRGSHFAPAFRKGFPTLPVAIHRLIEAGDLSGRLPEALFDTVTQLEFDKSVQDSVAASLRYPSILVLGGLGAILFIVMKVLPNFSGLFARDMTALPAYTRSLFHLSELLNAHPYVSLGVAAGVVVGLISLFRHPDVKLTLLTAIGRAPVIGAWVTDVETARWSAIFARLVRNKVPLLQALELARGVVSLPFIRARLIQAEKRVRGGQTLAVALTETAAFPPAVINLVGIGERSGKLAETMESAADLYGGIFKTRTKQMLALIEPLAIVFIGLVVAAIAIPVLTTVSSVSDLAL